jgi:hypothetical protein
MSHNPFIAKRETLKGCLFLALAGIVMLVTPIQAQTVVNFSNDSALRTAFLNLRDAPSASTLNPATPERATPP